MNRIYLLGSLLLSLFVIVACFLYVLLWRANPELALLFTSVGLLIFCFFALTVCFYYVMVLISS
jgi:hypothetical protein